MIKRLELILKTQNLSPSLLADKLNIQRSGISHLLSGRNKPSLDFITKILNVFPEINSDWLLFGKGNMYKNQEQMTELNFPPHESINSQKVNEVFFHEEALPKVHENLEQLQNSNLGHQQQNLNLEQSAPSFEKRENLEKNKIERIIVFYSNGSFQEFSPSL